MRLFAALALSLSCAATASAQPGRSVPDPCTAPEVTIPIAFDLYRGRVAPSELAVVNALAAHLRRCPERAFELQVHTDTVRTAAFNARGSRAVAAHLVELLAARGVEIARLAPCGYGESQPISRDPSWDARAPSNRLVVRALSGSASSHRCPAAG